MRMNIPDCLERSEKHNLVSLCVRIAPANIHGMVLGV
jgi:hypothetical protein